jgi:hypothetical protein
MVVTWMMVTKLEKGNGGRHKYLSRDSPRMGEMGGKSEMLSFQ